jgi:hypothetical protein
MNLEEIASEAAMLDEESRASLASRILRSLTPPANDVSDEDVFRRIREADEDPSVMITHEELLSGINRRGD